MTTSRAYFKLVWKRHLGFAVFSMVFITLLQFLVLYLITTFNMPAIIKTVLAQMPEKMKVYFSDNFFNTLTLDGAAAFGFNHPMVLTLLSIVAISIPISHISREIELGTLELLLAQPFKRSSLLLTLWMTGGLILLVIIAAAFMGSISAAAIFHHADSGLIMNMLKIALNLWLLFVVVMTYTLLLATYKPLSLRASNVSSVLTLVFYLLYFLSQVWDDIKFLAPYNIFTYYEPQKMMFGKGNFSVNCLVLSVLIILTYITSRRQFIRRDIP